MRKGTLPHTPESFRTKLRIERNLWLYLATKYNNRVWLVGLTPSCFDLYTDYFLGRKVMLLELCHEDGSRRPLNPPWNVILSYELECRRAAILLVTESGSTLADALAAVVRDPELKELAFTSTVAHLGRGGSSRSSQQSSGKGSKSSAGQHIVDNPNYPLKRDGPYQKQAKGKGKARGKGKEKKQSSKAPDGREICYAFNSSAGCSSSTCNRAHICRIAGCLGPHSQMVCTKNTA